MILLASEQLWPNIHGLVHWHKTGLTDLFIYHTSDEERSLHPAQRLAQLAKTLYRDIHVHLAKGPMTPDGVAAQIEAWKQQNAQCGWWIVNATGGVKLMFAGALEHVGTEHTQVVYRELTGSWFRLDREQDGIRATEIEVEVDPAETDAIPLETLLNAQRNPQMAPDATLQPAKRYDVEQLTKAGIETGWNWQQMFRLNQQGGLLFERYVAAALLEMGLWNLQTNLILRGSEGQVLHEIDIVANHRGRILIFDCKLRPEEEEGDVVEPITSQIRQVAHTQRQLGGLGARSILIRPNRWIEQELRDMAQAIGVVTIGQADAKQLFSNLARFAGADLPASLQRAEEQLKRDPHAFLRETRLERQQRETWGGQAVVDLDEYRSRLKQDWVAYRLSNGIWIEARVPNELPGLPNKPCKQRVISRIRERLGVEPDAENLWLSRSRNTTRFQLLWRRENRTQMLEALKGAVGQSLLGNSAPTNGHRETT